MTKGVKKMKTSILVSLIAVLLVLSAFSVIATDIIDIDKVEVDGLIADSVGTVAVESGKVVPVEVYFTANENASDVEISAWIRGERSDAAEINFKDLIEDKDYRAVLTLKLPSDIDETEEEKTLFIRIETDKGNIEEEYTLTIQREPYNAELLFVEVDESVEAGSNIPIDVVLKNLGRHELDDLLVEVSIPELGISKRAYFSDLTPTDDWEDDDDTEDAVERRVYLRIPANADAGNYELTVEAYNSDTSSVVTRIVTVVGAEGVSKVLIPVSSKEIGFGETVTYDLIIVNSGSKVGIYEVIPETTEGVIVSAEDPVVTVAAGSSKVVRLQVKAGSRDGIYAFAVDVNSEGQLVNRAVLTANVVESGALGAGISNNVAILTVVLAIIFVVLLVVLIVLLTKKPSKAEEFEESYY